MKSVPVLIAAAIACSLGIPAAQAQERGYRRDFSPAQKHYRGGHRYGGHRHHYYSRPHWRFAAPYRPWRYYDPYWYPAPAFAYPYPIYEPAPVIVERVYEPPVYEYEAPPPPVERPRPYRERPLAQAEPSRTAPKAAAIPEPRLERYTLSAKELFEFDKATLRMPQARLDEIADVMKRNPDIDDVEITGHTDRLGSEAYNLQLSQRRAEAVKSYLVQRGVEARRLKAVGAGEAYPVKQCDDAAKERLIQCLEPNRRVEVESITVERRVPARS